MTVWNVPVAVECGGIDSIVQTGPEHVTGDGVEPVSEPVTYSTPSGKPSETTTFVAVSGPLFVTVTVHVIVSPSIAACALATFVMVRSAFPGSGGVTCLRTLRMMQTT